jgi:hypothetical protein
MIRLLQNRLFVSSSTIHKVDFLLLAEQFVVLFDDVLLFNVGHDESPLTIPRSMDRYYASIYIYMDERTKN